MQKKMMVNISRWNRDRVGGHLNNSLFDHHWDEAWTSIKRKSFKKNTRRKMRREAKKVIQETLTEHLMQPVVCTICHEFCDGLIDCHVMQMQDLSSLGHYDPDPDDYDLYDGWGEEEEEQYDPWDTYMDDYDYWYDFEEDENWKEYIELKDREHKASERDITIMELTAVEQAGANAFALGLSKCPYDSVIFPTTHAAWVRGWKEAEYLA
tara:strand:- start:368 stop:994 length:627 start_codon:yes stop_codon:yes gene_type:complete